MSVVAGASFALLAAACRLRRRAFIADPAIWYGAALAQQRDKWVYELSVEEQSEIEQAVKFTMQRFKQQNKLSLATYLASIDVADFALPILGQVLANIRKDIVRGKGFSLIRGMPIDKLGGAHSAETVVAYLGVGLHFGIPVSQNKMGHVLGHVCDHGEDPNDPAVRVYRTTRRQRFHTDSCDVVGLLCLVPAKMGGKSSICSSATVYREMQLRAPHLLAELESLPGLFWDRKGEVPEGELPYYRGPVFNHARGKVLGIYDRNFFTTCHRHGPPVPPLSEQQLQALDLLEELCEDEIIRLDMMMRPGDMQLLHNHQIFHARAAFTDHPERAHKRHLLRLWLSVPEPLGWRLPQAYKDGRYDSIDGPVRGGISVPGLNLQVPLQPE